MARCIQWHTKNIRDGGGNIRKAVSCTQVHRLHTLAQHQQRNKLPGVVSGGGVGGITAVISGDKNQILRTQLGQEVSQPAVEFIQSLGCNTAYALDGGQTTAIVMNDELITLPDYQTQRKISDIIYFATALPDGG